MTATKKPTAKQLAARKLFAERARAGTLGGKRKANPVSKSGNWFWVHANTGPHKVGNVYVKVKAYTKLSAAEQVAKSLGYPTLIAARGERYEFVDADQEYACVFWVYDSAREDIKYKTLASVSKRKSNPIMRKDIFGESLTRKELAALIKAQMNVEKSSKEMDYTRVRLSPKSTAEAVRLAEIALKRLHDATKAKLAKRVKNPTPRKTVKMFWCVDKSSGKNDWSRLGFFDEKTDAEKYAKAYADSYYKHMRVYHGYADKMPDLKHGY